MKTDFEERIARLAAKEQTPAAPQPPPPPPQRSRSGRRRFVVPGVIAIAIVGALLPVGVAFAALVYMTANDPTTSTRTPAAPKDTVSAAKATGSKILNNAKVSYILMRYESGKLTKEEAMEKLKKAGVTRFD